MVYKSLNALAPDYLRNIFQKVSEATNRQLRNSKTDLRLPLLGELQLVRNRLLTEGLGSGVI